MESLHRINQSNSKTTPKLFQNYLKRQFGASWVALGDSGALLRLSWRPTWGHQITRSKSREKMINDLGLGGSILTLKTVPRTTPTRPQNMSKIKTKNGSLFLSLVDPSWTVLKLSWRRYGALRVQIGAHRSPDEITLQAAFGLES